MFVCVCVFVYTNALVIKVKLLCREEFKAIKKCPAAAATTGAPLMATNWSR